jgi:hypothetical protein
MTLAGFGNTKNGEAGTDAKILSVCCNGFDHSATKTANDELGPCQIKFLRRSQMFHARSTIPVFLTLILTLPGCNSGPSNPLVSIQPGTATIQGAGVLSANANCPSGQQLLGGGYFLDGDLVATTPIAVTENYPFSGTTWRVTVDSTSAKPTDNIAGTVIIALAYCFTKPNIQLDMTTVSAITTPGPPAATGPDVIIHTAAGSTTCPVGSVLTGVGFQIINPTLHQCVGYNAYITAEAPIMNTRARGPGWQVNIITPSTISAAATIYARCAGSFLKAGSVASLAPSTPGTGTVSCPANTFTTAGGYSLQNDSPIPSPIVFNYVVYSSYLQNGEKITHGNLPHPIQISLAGGWHTDYAALYEAMTVSAYCIPIPTQS